MNKIIITGIAIDKESESFYDGQESFNLSDKNIFNLPKDTHVDICYWVSSQSENDRNLVNKIKNHFTSVSIHPKD